MQSCPFKEIRDALKVESFQGSLIDSLNSYSIDSRTIQKGDLYFAIKGDRFDGHDYIAEVLKKGAAGVVYSIDMAIPLSEEQFAFKVSDTCEAFQNLSHYYRGKQSVDVVGITGSNGKTTTKEWVSQLCAISLKTHKTEGTKNNHIGVPLTLLELTSDHQVAVIEMGMSGLGEIDRLAEIAQPNFGIVTSIGSSHLEQLGSVENVYKAKKELVDRVAQNQGTLFLNGDDPLVIKMKDETEAKVFTFGTDPSFDYVARNISVLKDSVLFELVVKEEGFVASVALPHLGRHNVLNCLSAVAVAHQLGGALDLLVAGCSKLVAPSMRLEQLEKDGVLFINDAYNANPTSMEVALDVLEEMEIEGKKIFVCGDMLELGMVSELAHQQLGEKVYDSKVDVLVTYGHLSQATAQRAIESGMNEADVFVCYEKKAIPDILKDVATPGDVVLLKGSRRNQLEKVLDEWRSDEQKEVVNS